MTPSKDRKPNGRSGYGRFFVVEAAAGGADVLTAPLPLPEPLENSLADSHAAATQTMLLRAVDAAMDKLRPASQNGPTRPPANK